MIRLPISITMVFIVLFTGLVAKADPSGDETSDDSEKTEKSEVPTKRRARKPISEIVQNLDYPELQVVPRASERLRIEAKSEDDSWFFTHWPIELSGLATLGLGLSANGQLREGLSAKDKSDAGTVATVTQAVGAGWLVAGVLIGMQRPYRSGLRNVARMGGKDERSILLRERLAEESLEKPARFMGPLVWASVLSNFGLSAFTGVYLTDQGRVMAGVSSILAFLPLMYEDHNITVFEKHLEYKRKIYAPLTSLGLKYESGNRSYIPTTTLTWLF